MLQNDIQGQEANTARAMGQGGMVFATDEIKALTTPIAGIAVLSGTATVTGTKLSTNSLAESPSNRIFGVGTYVLPLADISLTATTGTTIIYLG